MPRTGTGEHLVFKHPGPHIPNDVGSKLGEGLDIRADGGYILVEPSLHPNGQRYAWHDGYSPKDMTHAAAPAWLESRIMTTAHERHASQNGDRTIPEGQRNDTLFRDGCAMRERGFEHEAILAALIVTNEHCCHPPLAPDEVEAIAASAAKYRQGPGTIIRLIR
jgi:putative DNA primase/helicase